MAPVPIVAHINSSLANHYKVKSVPLTFDANKCSTFPAVQALLSKMEIAPCYFLIPMEMVLRMVEVTIYFFQIQVPDK